MKAIPKVVALCLFLFLLPLFSEGAEPNGHAADFDDRGGWSILRHPKSRLAHGWLVYESNDDGNAIVREHVGGGMSAAPIAAPLKLELKTKTDGGFLVCRMIRRWEDRSATLETKTTWPIGATIRPAPSKRFTGLSTNYQILWRADLVVAGEVVKSAAYVARLSPVGEQCGGFDRREIAKVKAILLEAEQSRTSDEISDQAQESK